MVVERVRKLQFKYKNINKFSLEYKWRTRLKRAWPVIMVIGLLMVLSWLLLKYGEVSGVYTWVLMAGQLVLGLVIIHVATESRQFVKVNCDCIDFRGMVEVFDKTIERNIRIDMREMYKIDVCPVEDSERSKGMREYPVAAVAAFVEKGVAMFRLEFDSSEDFWEFWEFMQSKYPDKVSVTSGKVEDLESEA